MAGFASIAMSTQDPGRLKTMQAIIDGNLKASTAAKRLQLTKRQVIGSYNGFAAKVLRG